MNDISNQETKTVLYINIKIQYHEAIQSFENEISSADLIHNINTSPMTDPNTKYKIIHEVSENARNKHIPRKWSN